MSTSSRTPARPLALVLLAVVLGIEAVATAGIGLLAIAASPGGDGVTSGVSVAVFLVVLAALLAMTAVGMFRARPWTRAAALVWQLVQMLVGAYSFQGAGAAVGFGAGAIGLGVLGVVLLFTRAVREATNRA